MAGIPGLANIPILKYLFGQTTQDHSENEIVFAITPHIIRGTDVSQFNQEAIDIGTANTIALRHVALAVCSGGNLDSAGKAGGAGSGRPAGWNANSGNADTGPERRNEPRQFPV